MSKIGSPLTLDLTNTRAFKTWLYQLWQGVGGHTDTGSVINNNTKAKQTIVDLGATYIQDKTVNVIDAEITATSIIECSIAPVASGYTRPVEEVIYERIMVYATPKAGSIDFYLQPERGHFKGEFVINYMVKI